MKYFVYDHQRDGSCYHEFYKGKWDGKTFWKADSISLDDDFLFKGFIDAIVEVVPSYDPFGVTEISIDEWKKIGEVILTKDIESQVVYYEANVWLNRQVFTRYNCFTILGI
jgi:hypothetical protein